DAYFAQIWKPDYPAALRSRLEEMLESRLLDGDEAYRRRVGSALVLAGIRQGDWPESLVALTVPFVPALLACSWVPLAVRQQAAGRIARLGGRCPHTAVDQVKNLATSELARQADGRPDVLVLASLLHLVGEDPYKRLEEWLKKPVKEQLRREPDHVIDLLG